MCVQRMEQGRCLNLGVGLLRSREVNLPVPYERVRLWAAWFLFPNESQPRLTSSVIGNQLLFEQPRCNQQVTAVFPQRANLSIFEFVNEDILVVVETVDAVCVTLNN